MHSSSVDLSKKPKPIETRNSSISSSIANKNEVLNKIFGDYDEPSKTVGQRVKFNQSLSFDESSLGDFGGNGTTPLSASSTASSRRFEEFKRVVESSYEQHVLNKFNDLNLSPINKSNPNPPLPPLDITSPRIIGSATTPTTTSSVMKIPYMSAYNIYDEDSSARVNVNLEVTKKLTTAGSNGSSLTTSPTSISSGEAAANPPIEVPSSNLTSRGAEITAKPPITPKPKSGELTFRKNLLRRSSANTPPVVSKSQPFFADSLEIAAKPSKGLYRINIEQILFQFFKFRSSFVVVEI